MEIWRKNDKKRVRQRGGTLTKGGDKEILGMMTKKRSSETDFFFTKIGCEGQQICSAPRAALSLGTPLIGTTI